jgi:hypothetical protein
MNRRVLGIAVTTIAALGFTARVASAACDFLHPRSAKKFKFDLVQAFVSCGNVGGNVLSNLPNDTTGSGIPSCNPPQTFNETVGSPPNGWLWDPATTQGTVTIKAARDRVSSVQGAQDVSIKLKLDGVIDRTGAPASATGTLSATLRATWNDPGDDGEENDNDISMTVVDFPLSFKFTLDEGKVRLKTSVNRYLLSIGINPLPGCTSIELVDLVVQDANGSEFARPGLYLVDEIMP